jgi:hypothetical protein
VESTGLLLRANAELTVPASLVQVGAVEQMFAQVDKSVFRALPAALAPQPLGLRLQEAIVVQAFGVESTGVMPTVNVELTAPASPVQVGVEDKCLPKWREVFFWNGMRFWWWYCSYPPFPSQIRSRFVQRNWQGYLLL